MAKSHGLRQAESTVAASGPNLGHELSIHLKLRRYPEGLQGHMGASQAIYFKIFETFEREGYVALELLTMPGSGSDCPSEL